MKIKILAFVFFIAGPIFSAKAQAYTSIKQVAQRRVPWLAAKLVFTSISKEGGKDVFELFTKDNRVHIAASGASAASSALNWYLKYYCHRSMSHLGDNLSAVSRLPVVKSKIRMVSPFPVRYALNYCTINYTMSFYTWTDWERELDWMALQGVNLLLVPVGMEAVWQNTLKKIGFSDKEIFDFIPGPAFSAWWLMGNLEGWGGPVTQSIIDQQVALEKNILKRMKELGMQPVLQGFYGMVPAVLKNKRNVQVIEQGKWAGGFQRPDFLLPTDTMFKKIAGIYYTEMKKLYGDAIPYFGGDPFHEGGSSKGADVTKAAKEIQRVMQQYYPGSTWVLQGWQANPSSQLLNGLDKSRTLVIELFGENTNNWEQRKGYENTPFVWSHVSNFGEKTGLFGKLQRFASELYRAKNSQYGPLLKGVGIIPEGITNNPVAYDLMLELGWHTDSVEVRKWIKNYVRYRYGKSNEAVENAWQLFLETVYSSPEVRQEGPSESIFCARPSLTIKSVSSWGTRKRAYDTQKFEQAVKLFVSASNEMRQSETYGIDKIDFVRQVLANKGDAVYQAMVDAINNKDEKSFVNASTLFQQMILQQDSLLSSSKHFSLSTWLQQANNFGKTAADKSIALKNAKTQITYWGPDNPATDLHEYAHKEWGGLLSSLYLARWKLFSDNALKKINNQPVSVVNYFQLEKEWTEGKELYFGQTLSKGQQEALINRILQGPN